MLQINGWAQNCAKRLFGDYDESVQNSLLTNTSDFPCLRGGEEASAQRISG